MAYCLEEAPHCRTPQMGSAVHAAALRSSGARCVPMMSLEMIGYFPRRAGQSTRLPLPGMGLVLSTAGNFIVVGIFGQSRDYAPLPELRAATTFCPSAVNRHPAGAWN